MVFRLSDLKMVGGGGQERQEYSDTESGFVCFVLLFLRIREKNCFHLSKERIHHSTYSLVSTSQRLPE